MRTKRSEVELGRRHIKRGKVQKSRADRVRDHILHGQAQRARAIPGHDDGDDRSGERGYQVGAGPDAEIFPPRQTGRGDHRKCQKHEAEGEQGDHAREPRLV